MRLPVDVPEEMIVVPRAKDCCLLLPVREYLAGIRRGKWWRRRQAMLARAFTPPPSQQATFWP